MRRALNSKFFDRPTLKVARELLGKFLVRRIGKKVASGIITEVEAYVGPEDQASHAHRGEKTRNRIMFRGAGIWYVYFTYGMHWMLNIVTEREGYPAAILIRGLESVSGPGRLTKFLKIDGRFNEKQAQKSTGLWIEDRGVKVNPRRIKRGKRIGVDYAGKWKDKPWRFYLR